MSRCQKLEQRVRRAQDLRMHENFCINNSTSIFLLAYIHIHIRARTHGERERERERERKRERNILSISLNKVYQNWTENAPFVSAYKT